MCVHKRNWNDYMGKDTDIGVPCDLLLHTIKRKKIAIVNKYGGQWIVIIRSCSLLVLLD